MDLTSATPQFQYDSAVSGRRSRLLRLLPGCGSHQLCLHLSEFDLEQSPPFVALSYAWGDQQARKIALFNGRSVSITNSLYAALWQMREDGEQGYIWADAICINQGDLVEKTQQVRMMGDIYEKAQTVLIWLGPEEPGDRNGLFLMKELCEMLKVGPGPKLSVDLYLSGIYAVPSERWVAMVRFLRKPWFWRVWILQEYQKSRDRIFQCGRMLMTADFFKEFYFLVSEFPELKQLTQLKGLILQAGEQPHLFAPFFELQRIFDVQKIKQFELPIHRLLLKTRGFQSSDPRDQIFAIVGLSSDTSVDLINYKAHLSDVLTEISAAHIRAILASSPVSDVFDYLCSVHDSNIEGLPSWVPTFELSESFWTMRGIFWTEKALKSTPEIHLGDKNTLGIGGRIVDQIKTMIDSDLSSKPLTAVVEADFKAGFARSQEIIKFITDSWGLALAQMPYHTKEDPSEVFWKSLVFDTGDVRTHDRSLPEMRRTFETWHESVMLCHFHMQIGVQVQNGNPPLPSQAHALESLQDATPYLKWRPSNFEPDRIVDSSFMKQIMAYSMQEKNTQLAFIAPFARFSFDRRYFASDCGYVGWVPCHAREGDQICAFYGSRYPFVVRQCGDSWRLIGACFMHGLMEGEAVLLSEMGGERDGMIKLI